MNENLSKCEETSAIDSWRNSDEYISKFNINVLGYTYYDCDSLEKVSWQAGWFKEEKERSPCIGYTHQLMMWPIHESSTKLMANQEEATWLRPRHCRESPALAFFSTQVWVSSKTPASVSFSTRYQNTQSRLKLLADWSESGFSLA